MNMSNVVKPQNVKSTKFNDFTALFAAIYDG